MKHLITSLLLLATLSCSAMPPAHKPVRNLFADIQPGGGAVTGVNFYKANPADTDWTPAGSVPGTNGMTVSIPFDPNYSLYTADTTNALDGSASDYCAVYTNTVPAVPAVKGK